MNSADFWTSVKNIIDDGFTSEGLQKLDYYAELFIRGRLVYKRFSSQEQHGCSAGGAVHVIASLLAGAENCPDSELEGREEFKRELKYAEKQARAIEKWARKVNVWYDDVDKVLNRTFGEQIAEGGEANVYDHGTFLVKSIGLDYFIQPILALDRITLHNTYFSETSMRVLGFVRDSNDEFKIIVEQPFIQGLRMSDEEIETFMSNMGFVLMNRKNWTYATPYIYLSDMHDENVMRSENGTVFVVDCDIRINTPKLRHSGVRVLSNNVIIDM